MKAHLRPQRLAVLLTALFALIGISFVMSALADTLQTDGDLLEAGLNQPLELEDAICASGTATANAKLYIRRSQLATTNNVFANSAAVALTVVSVVPDPSPPVGASDGSSQVSVADPADLTMPADWSTQTEGDLYPASGQTVVVTIDASATPGFYAAMVNFRAQGAGGGGGTATKDRTLDVSWTVVDCANPEIKVEKAAAKEYFLAGGPVEYRYEVTNPGNVPLSSVAVTDDQCGTATYVSGDANTDAKLDVGETWVFSCSYTPPFTGPSTVLDNVATATGAYDGQVVDDKDGLKLLGAVIRKAVFLYWQAGGPDRFVDYDAPGVAFDVKLFERGVGEVGTEQVAENDPLELWLTLKASNASEPGWRFVEQPKTGYPVADGRGTIGFDVVEGGDYLDNTLINTIDFDLSLVKSAPKFVGESGHVTFRYTVTNDGPAAVKPVVTDDSCTGVYYHAGDTNGDHLIQASETWVFKCHDTLSWHFGWTGTPGAPWCDTNTGTVVADELPDPSFWNAWEFYGGDVDEANDESELTLCPTIIRKDVVEYGTGDPLSDTRPFKVVVKHEGDVVGFVWIAEGNPARFWLQPGVYTFCEKLQLLYHPNHECWTQTVGTDYPDWTVVNARWWFGCSHGFYKNEGYRTGWQALAPPVGGSYLPTTPIDGPFDVPAGLKIGTTWIGSYTLYQALSFKGGNTLSGSAQILLRQAVAALLNESRYGPKFPPYVGTGPLITAVNGALASGSRTTMLNLASELDFRNNGYCASCER